MIASNDWAEKSADKALVAQILELPTIPVLQELTTSYEAGQNGLVVKQQQYGVALSAYSVLLLLGYLGYQMMRSNRQLKRTNSVLLKTNDELKGS